MNLDPAIVRELEQHLLHKPISNALAALLRDLKRSGRVLVFRKVGVDVAGRELFEVGIKGGVLTTFAAKGSGVGYLHQAITNRPAGVALVDHKPDAIRMSVRRCGGALDQIEANCRELASELRRNAKVTCGAVVYLPAINSPQINTD